MAPQTSIPTSANVLGTLGTASGLFRIYANWRTKKTDGLPGSMLFVWAVCGVPFGTYAIAQNFNIPLQIQPQVFCALSLVSWAQTLIYHNNWPSWKASAIAVVSAAIFGGVEAALVITLRPLYERDISYPMIIVGAFAAVLLTIGLILPYYEIWKRRGRVIGINWVFLTIDWFGAFFSLMALVAQNSFDVMGGVLYIICLVLEGGIFASHLIFKFRTRRIVRAAKREGKTFDDILREHAEHSIEFAFSERSLRARKKDPEEEEEVLASNKAFDSGSNSASSGGIREIPSTESMSAGP